MFVPLKGKPYTHVLFTIVLKSLEKTLSKSICFTRHITGVFYSRDILWDNNFSFIDFTRKCCFVHDNNK